MKYEMEMHDGECGFCGTAVPVYATVCAGCGARWGSKHGNTPDEVYRDSKKLIKEGIMLACIPIGSLALCWLTGASWLFLIFIIIGPFVGMAAVMTLLFGWLGLRSVKKLKIAWWRKQ